jgi:hypothetical protein
MIKFINILSDVIVEQKRHKFEPETYEKIHSIVSKLWNDRNYPYKGKTVVDYLPITTKDGVQGQVEIRVNPRLKYIGFMGTKPKDSRDPMDIYIEVNPKFYESKKNLYLTMYHELIHAIDPTQSTQLSPKYLTTYNEKYDEQYWGHPIEFFAITNEFLEGLVLEFKRRADRIRNEDNRRHLHKSFNNILNYFGKGEKLSKVSSDILYKINDEYVQEEEISKVLDDLITNNPHLADYITMPEDVPYYLHYVELIKKYNPKIWKRFLTMLFKVKDEIETIINKEGV